MATALSPNYSTADFETWPPSIDDMINVHIDRVRGWQLDIAEHSFTHPHGAYGALWIMLSYFEATARFWSGCMGHKKSKTHFQKGLVLVFPELQAHSALLTLVDVLYGEARNGLYHLGMIRRVPISGYPWTLLLLTANGPEVLVDKNGRVLSGGDISTYLKDMKKGIRYNEVLSEPIVLANPHHLLPAIQRHLGEYEKQLQDPSNSDLRQRFLQASNEFHTPPRRTSQNKPRRG